MNKLYTFITLFLVAHTVIQCSQPDDQPFVRSDRHNRRTNRAPVVANTAEQKAFETGKKLLYDRVQQHNSQYSNRRINFFDTHKNSQKIGSLEQSNILHYIEPLQKHSKT